MTCDGCKFTYQGEIQPVDPNDPEITVSLPIKNSLGQVVCTLDLSFTPENGECVESQAGCDPSSVCELGDVGFVQTVGPGSAPSGVQLKFEELMPDGTRVTIGLGFVDPLIPTHERDGMITERLMACGTDPIKLEATFLFHDLGTHAAASQVVPFEFGCTPCEGGEEDDNE
jgi:hypothetical protein